MKIFKQTTNKLNRDAYDYIGVHLQSKDGLIIRLLSLLEGRSISMLVAEALAKRLEEVSSSRGVVIYNLAKKAHAVWEIQKHELPPNGLSVQACFDTYTETIRLELARKKIPSTVIYEILNNLTKLVNDEENQEIK